MKVTLLYNPTSGQNFSRRALTKLFRNHDVEVADAFDVRQLPSKKLTRLINQGAIVAVVGGDGTLNAAAQLIAGTKSTLLPLPGGTFNHFVRDLGMDGDLLSILKNLPKAKVELINVAKVNDQLFLNNSNIGMYPFSLIERKHAKRILGKWLAAAWAAIDQLVEFRRRRLFIDGRSVRTPFVFIGNNAYDLEAGGLPPKKTLRGGRLFIVISTAHSRWALMKTAYLAMRGKVRDHNDVKVIEAKEISIESRRPTLMVSYDGEAGRLTTPLRYQLLPKHLRVMYVPKSDV